MYYSRRNKEPILEEYPPPRVKADKTEILQQLLYLQRECTHKQKLVDHFKRTVVCEEKECKRYEILTRKHYLKIYTLIFHVDQKFQKGHKPIEHRCIKEKGQPKYMDEGGRAYSEIESFQDRLELPEIEIQ